MKRSVIVSILSLIPLYTYAFYPDSAKVIGFTHHWAATGVASGNRVSVRDSQGNIHAVFYYKWEINFADSAEIYYVCSSDNGQTWSNMMNVSHTDSAVSKRVTLAIDHQDDLHCVWQQYIPDSNAYDLYYSKYDGIDWITPINITQQFATSHGSHSSSMVIDSNDNIHIVYGAPFGFYNVFYISYIDSIWNIPINLSNVSWDADFPCIALDAQDNLHVVWRERTLNAPIMYSKYDGSIWSVPEVIASMSGGQSYAPCIVVDSNDFPHVIWEWSDLLPDSGNIYYTAYNGSSWSAPINLSNSVTPSTNHSMAIDTCNNLYVVWSEKINDNSEIYYITYNGSQWSNISNISQDTVSSFCPKLASPARFNKVDLVWTSYATPLLEVVYLGLDSYSSIREYDVPTAVNQPKIHISPNPFKDELFIQVEYSAEAPPYTDYPNLIVYNIAGRLITKLYPVTMNKYTSKFMWLSHDLPNGIYFLRIDFGRNALINKIVKID